MPTGSSGRRGDGLPLAKPITLGRSEMTNLIGNETNDYERWLTVPGTSIHLYRKNEIRPGRKMAHLTRAWPAR